jgi:hypothetical protein
MFSRAPAEFQDCFIHTESWTIYKTDGCDVGGWMVVRTWNDAVLDTFSPWVICTR